MECDLRVWRQPEKPNGHYGVSMDLRGVRLLTTMGSSGSMPHGEAEIRLWVMLRGDEFDKWEPFTIGP